jgi:hypothetical protein
VSNRVKEAPVWKPDRRTAAERLVGDWAAHCARPRPVADGSQHRLTAEAAARYGFPQSEADAPIHALRPDPFAVEGYQRVLSPDELSAFIESLGPPWSQPALPAAPPDQDPDATPAPRIKHRGGRPWTYDWVKVEVALEAKIKLQGGVPHAGHSDQKWRTPSSRPRKPMARR